MSEKSRNRAVAANDDIVEAEFRLRDAVQALKAAGDKALAKEAARAVETVAELGVKLRKHLEFGEIPPDDEEPCPF